jgi:polyisoprenoid-binding protein YceI
MTNMTNTSTLASGQTATTTWNIDPAHTVAEFKVKHMMIANVKGQFSKLSGVLTLDESALENSRIEATIEAASIETRDGQRRPTRIPGATRALASQRPPRSIEKTSG